MKKDKLSDLIKGLQILLKYEDPGMPTHCEHDILYINVNAKEVSEKDLNELDELGIFPDDDFGSFISYRFGSA